MRKIYYFFSTTKKKKSFSHTALQEDKSYNFAYNVTVTYTDCQVLRSARSHDAPSHLSQAWIMFKKWNPDVTLNLIPPIFTVDAKYKHKL